MLSHLCQARLWTKSDRKGNGDGVADSSCQLKLQPVHNRIFQEDGSSLRESKTNCLIYPHENNSSLLEESMQRNSWSTKHNRQELEGNIPSPLPVDCVNSRVSENPAYGLSQIWPTFTTTDNSVKTEILPRETTDRNCETPTRSQNTTLNTKIHQNNSKICYNHINNNCKYHEHERIHSSSCNKNSVGCIKESNRQPFDNNNLNCVKSTSSIRTTKDDPEETFPTDYNSFTFSKENCKHSKIKKCEETYAQSPSSKLECGSTFLSHANRKRTKIQSLPFASEKLNTDQEVSSLWTESHLPTIKTSNIQNPNINEWFELMPPRYQKFPFQKHLNPSSTNQSSSQNVDEILLKSSQNNPANISMVIMKSTCLYSSAENQQSILNSVLPMGSLVTALYKECDAVCVQTPHGLKGFMKQSNCMAMGTLTDQFFAAVDEVVTMRKSEMTEQHAKNTENMNKDLESSEDESEPEQPVSMAPITETNYSKLADAKTSINSFPKSDVEELLSMISKHGLCHTKSLDNVKCQCDKSETLNDNSTSSLILQQEDKGVINTDNYSSEDCKIKSTSDAITLFPILCSEQKYKEDSPNDTYNNESSDEIMNRMDILKNVSNTKSQNILFSNIIKNNNIVSTKDKGTAEELEVSFVHLSDAFLQVQDELYLSKNKISCNEDATYTDSGNSDTLRNKNNVTKNKCNEECVSGYADSDRTEDLIDYKQLKNESNSLLATANENVSKHNSTCENYCSNILAVIQDYTSEEESTLTVKRGDLVTLIKTVDTEWIWVRSTTGAEGYIPCVCTSQVGIF